ncbi:SCO family protein [Leptospira yasudae]|uniref:SCO family protein n=1 Tax=Leptospira yasudae TaxID=2202201 RepID=A0A6N4QBY2_9LEPT|nr:SCO family protein [Leptospira yasudae]TGL74419.1 SCO family protein [Leptospira yasudae]TGL80549.1 SCO family protein [Leptospira yasudae]TGL84349.1 SCO family protein [Leptospira yasudae]
MKAMKKIQIFVYSILIILFVVACGDDREKFNPELTYSSSPKAGILPYFKGAVMDPFWPEADGKLPEDLKRIPEISLVSHENKEFNNRDLRDKYTLVVFFYAKCKGICPMITRNMMNFVPKIADQKDVQIVSISINPEIDNVEILKKFRNQYKITQNNWTFLTGSQKTIYNLARNEFGADVKVIQGQDDLNDFVHTENVFLLDRKQYLRGIYRAKGYGDLERLKIELETLKQEDRKNAAVSFHGNFP